MGMAVAVECRRGSKSPLTCAVTKRYGIGALELLLLLLLPVLGLTAGLKALSGETWCAAAAGAATCSELRQRTTSDNDKRRGSAKGYPSDGHSDTIDARDRQLLVTVAARSLRLGGPSEGAERIFWFGAVSPPSPRPHDEQRRSQPLFASHQSPSYWIHQLRPRASLAAALSDH